MLFMLIHAYLLHNTNTSLSMFCLCIYSYFGFDILHRNTIRRENKK